MKNSFVAALVMAAFVGGATASAQVIERIWDYGTVWTIARVQTKPGNYNAYMKFFREVMVPRLEYAKKRGDVISWKVLDVNNNRESEPNLLILTEYRNMAVFDQGPAVREDMSRQLAGSAEARQHQERQSRELAEARGSMLAREIKFIK